MPPLALDKLSSTEIVQILLGCSSLDLFMEAMTKAGEGWFVATLLVGVSWMVNRSWRVRLWSALRGLVSLAVAGGLTQVLKRLVDAPRPLEILGPERVRVLMEPLRVMSFPSGHSAAAAAFAVWAARLPPGKKRLWPWLFAFLVGLSRIYVGAHWGTDVVAGWALGAAVAYGFNRVWPVRRPAVGVPAGESGARW